MIEGELVIPTRDEILDRLNTLPNLIKKKEFDVLGYSSNVSMYSEDMRAIEVTTKAEVVNEKEDGKNKYSNEALRQDQVNQRLERNQNYKNARVSWEHNKLQLQKGEINLRNLQNRFSAARYISRLIAGNQE